MDLRLQGKTALITGASGGIGSAIAEGMAEEGVQICLNYHSNAAGATRLSEKFAGMGLKSAAFKADVSKQDDVEAMVDFTIRE
ncbi:MAG: SDR family NAD(P)-dependent oxidoreductase, partial [Spirochaetaceae bacterium]|nr:SDR family NAD(P)-dependent oxidoreductase [Spirochaetaceae bacterium]